MKLFRFSGLWVLMSLLLASPVSAGEPRIVIVGGGPYPMHNQVSLEKNVQYFWRLKPNWGISNAPEKLFFADGKGEGRDLQIYDLEKEVSPILKALSIIFQGNEDLNYLYRNHQLPDAEETSSEALKAHFEGGTWTDADSLFFYYTGHGGRGGKEDQKNTSMNLWHRKNLKMVEFCAMLDALPEDLPVTLMMVQCYSGGFGNVIFKEGDPKKGLAKHLRCGFFATVHEKPAAGCTPSVDEADYREYSSYFLAALGGVTRVGEKVEDCDLDKDGVVSFLEAHAYAVRESATIDVPIRTGGVFLREYSKLPDRNSKDSHLLGTDSYSALLKVADVYDRSILEGMSQKLKLGGDDRVAVAGSSAEEVVKRRREADSKRKEKKKEIESLRGSLKREVAMRWPELANHYDPLALKVISDEGGSILKFLEGDTDFGKLLKAREEWQKAEDFFYEREEEWAQWARFIRTAENVALKANLPKVATEDIVVKFNNLEELEKGTLSRN